MYKKISQAVKVLREGGIIAYPTEGVFGLGCDPFNETAVKRLLKIKKRAVNKGLILITSNWLQVKKLIKDNLFESDVIKKSVKKPITWVFPATKKAPYWICGQFDSVAIRVTLHPVARKICQTFGGPVVSTSANLLGKKSATNSKQVQQQFGDQIDLVISERVGNLKRATQIRDAKTNKLIRR